MKEFIGFKKGINFGGWFSQCDYSKDRFDNFIIEEDFKIVKTWGFDHVRIPIDYNLILNDDYSFNEDGFKRIQKCIDNCIKYKLNMVLDIHKTVGFSFDSLENENGFFEKEEYQNIFYKIWLEITNRFGSYSYMLAFELLNEVTDIKYKDKWNQIASKCIETIRSINKDIKIIIGGYYNNAVSAVKDINVSFDDNIVLNFHCYEPLVFTHQGAYWVDKMNKYFRIRYHSTFKKIKEETINNISDYAFDYSFMDENEYVGPHFFETIFKEAIEYAESKNLSLYCGEYGVIELADPLDVKQWYKDINFVLNKYSICHALWSYKEMDFDFVNKKYDSVRKEIIGD